MIEIASDQMIARFDPFGARLRHIGFFGGPNLVLDADPVAAPAWAAAYGGVIVGPVANRVAQAAVELAGQTHLMDANEGPNCLHSGPDGMHAQTWAVDAQGPDSLTLTTLLPDGACGLPGARRIEAQFRLEGTTLHLDLAATSDRTTLMALAHHPYWDLGGPPTLTCTATHYLPVDDALIPTGAVTPVAGTDFDFGQPAYLPPQIDHNLCWLAPRGHETPMAILSGPNATMTIFSDQPGLQVYAGAGLPDLPGMGPFAGCALEPQTWPNAARMPDFPSPLLHPHTAYHQCVRYQFSAAT